MNPVKRLKIYVLGPRDYPEAIVTVREHLVTGLPELVERARAQNPAVRLDEIIATIWRLGCYRLGQNLLRGIPVRAKDHPAAGTTVMAPAVKKARRVTRRHHARGKLHSAAS